MDKLGWDYAFDVFITLIAYADDISAVIVGDTEAEIQTAVDLLMDEFLQYFFSAGLSMNPTKSELIVFRSRQQNQELFKDNLMQQR